MKKIGFLSFGVVLVFVILSLKGFTGISLTIKRNVLEVTHAIENVLIKVYQYIKPVFTGFENN